MLIKEEYEKDEKKTITTKGRRGVEQYKKDDEKRTKA